MTTTDHHTDPTCLALLARILETPADDAPRLILSDWLEENGEEERAVWIREEVERPRTAIIVSDLTIGATSLHEYAVSWSRGFISEVRLTCAEFMGGRCEVCQGAGRIATLSAVSSYLPRCPNCSGTGRIEGVARALFQTHPILTVTLVDAQPMFFTTTDIDYFDWYGSRIPKDLIKLIPNRGYEKEADARKALSDACVSYGRSLVGLPLL